MATDETLSNQQLIALINDLRNALLQRELRIGQLELQLSKALVSNQEQITPNIADILLPPPPPPASHPYSPHISAETSGLYHDGWIATKAKIVLHPGSKDGYYLISFWLPSDTTEKDLVITLGDGDSKKLKLRPLENVALKVTPPPDCISSVTICTETDRYIANKGDERTLGVFLVSVSWIVHDERM